MNLPEKLGVGFGERIIVKTDYITGEYQEYDVDDDRLYTEGEENEADVILSLQTTVDVLLSKHKYQIVQPCVNKNIQKLFESIKVIEPRAVWAQRVLNGDHIDVVYFMDRDLKTLITVSPSEDQFVEMKISVIYPVLQPEYNTDGDWFTLEELEIME